MSDGRTADAILGGNAVLGPVIVALGVVMLVRGLPNWFGFHTYPLQVRFDYAPGVTAGTPVARAASALERSRAFAWRTTTRA